MLRMSGLRAARDVIGRAAQLNQRLQPKTMPADPDIKVKRLMEAASVPKEMVGYAKSAHHRNRILRRNKIPFLYSTNRSKLLDPPEEQIKTPVTRPKILLPHWLIKIVRPGVNLKPSQVLFHIDGKMTKFDVKQYIEKIYKVPVKKVHTLWQLGKTKRRQGVKKKDFKKAYVELGDGYTFRYPDSPLEKAPDASCFGVPDDAPPLAIDNWTTPNVE